MSELSESNPGPVKPSATDAAEHLSEAKRQALHVMIGAQEMLLEEIVFAGNGLLDRARTETHLLSEFVSKMAESHSVSDVKAMYRDCSQHQLDFIRRDCERLFKHGERMLEI